jgi:hypothetical protein
VPSLSTSSMPAPWSIWMGFSAKTNPPLMCPLRWRRR